jgi:hypothetical protein
MPHMNAEIDEIVARYADWRGDTLARLRGIVHEADPDIVEEVKWRRPTNPLGAPVFEHDGIVCTAAILKERVRLSFPAGAILPDPNNVLSAVTEGNKTLILDVAEGDAIDEPALEGIIRAAVDRNLAKAKPARTR